MPLEELLERVRELEANERRMTSLLELGQRFMAERDPIALLRDVCDAARVMTNASIAGVSLVSEDLQRIERLLIAGLDDAIVDELRRTIPIDDTIRRVLDTRQPVRGHNPGGDPAALRLPAGHPPVHSFLIAPLASPSRVYGWFALAEKADAAPFTDIDERIATTLGVQIGMALENASLVSRLVEQAETLRDNEDDMEFAMSVSRIGVSYRDLDSNEIGLSRSLANLLSLPPGTRSISRDDFLALVHPDDVERIRVAVGSAVERRSEFELEYRVQAPGGGWRWFRSNGRVTSKRQGQRARLFSGMADVTESRSLELQLHQAQKMEAIGQLAGGVAHDFNNLLTAVSGYAGLLLEGASDPTQRHYVEEIIKASDRAAALTKQLLAFSRRQVRATAIVDLNELIQGMTAMLRPMIGEDITLTTRLAAGLSSVRADRGQLEQVVMNLVVNARDALRGGGDIDIETANVELNDITNPYQFAVKPGKYVMLAVRDTGTGMSEETKARLFEPFFTTKPRGEGTGLGLATTYGMVAQSGGAIWVYSEPNQGATFKVYLPGHEHAAAAVEAPAAAAPIKGGTETILLVEDERAVRHLVRMILERSGYTVVEAASPAEAEERWKTMAAPDLLLTDVVMPGGTGPDLFRRLSSRRPGLRVLFMSGYADRDLFDRAKIPPTAAFLEKPFSSVAMVAQVRAVLDAFVP